MKKVTFRYIVDVILFINIVGIIIVGLLLAFVLSKGPAVSEGSKYLLGLHRHQWGEIHFYQGMVFIAALIIHFLLEWNWIRGKSLQLFSEKWKVALTGTLVLALIYLGCFWWVAVRAEDQYVEHGSGPIMVGSRDVNSEVGDGSADGRPRRGLSSGSANRDRSADFETSGILISGRMTLREIEHQSGVSGRRIADELGLPSNTALDQTLGRLRKVYGFTMHDVRKTVDALMEESDGMDG